MSSWMTSFLTRGVPSADEAVSYLTSVLQDPMRAAGCRMQLRMTVGHIEDVIGETNLEIMVHKFGKAHPELLRAGIQFLTTRRSPSEHEAIIRHLVTRPCTCKVCDLSAKAGYAVGEGTQILAQMVTLIVNLLNGQIEKLHQHKFRSEHPENPADKQLWPQGPDDLLPCGVEDSIEGLIQWASGDLGSEPAILTLAGKLSTFYAPFAKGVLSAPYTLALKLPIQRLERATKKPPSTTLTPRENATGFVTEVRGVASLFGSLEIVDSHSFQKALFPMGQWAFPIFDKVEKHLLSLPLPKESYRDVLQWIGDYSGLYQMQQSLMGGKEFDFKSWIDPKGVDDLEEAWHCMGIAKKGLCWNASCPSSGTGVRARFCGQCKFIRYCSEECQREAWKSKEAPHKRLCLLICELKQQIGPKGWDEMWSPGFTYDGFKALCKKKRIDSNLVENIGNGLASVVLFRNLSK